jgi:hypothetical protein
MTKHMKAAHFPQEWGRGRRGLMGLSAGIQTKERTGISLIAVTQVGKSIISAVDRYLVFCSSPPFLDNCTLLSRCDRASAGRGGWWWWWWWWWWLGRCARYLEATVRRAGIWQVVAWPTGCNSKLLKVGRPGDQFQGREEQHALPVRSSRNKLPITTRSIAIAASRS